MLVEGILDRVASSVRQRNTRGPLAGRDRICGVLVGRVQPHHDPCRRLADGVDEPHPIAGHKEDVGLGDEVALLRVQARPLGVDLCRVGEAVEELLLKDSEAFGRLLHLGVRPCGALAGKLGKRRGGFSRRHGLKPEAAGDVLQKVFNLVGTAEPLHVVGGGFASRSSVLASSVFLPSASSCSM
jgi:hypothetical protein